MEDNKLNSIINNFTELEKKLSNLSLKRFFKLQNFQIFGFKTSVQKINQYNKKRTFRR